MRYIIVLLGLLIALAIAPAYGQEESEYWEPPDECADEDREIPGNRQSPCKYVSPKLERIIYAVNMYYPYCVEEMAFHLPGIRPLPPEIRGVPRAFFTNADGIEEWYEEGESIVNDYGTFDGYYQIVPDYLVFYGFKLQLDSNVGHRSRFDEPPEYRPTHIYAAAILPESTRWSNPALYPDISNWLEQVNTCLVLVQTEQTNREHAAAVKRQEAEEAAKRIAEADAVAKEHEQAIRQAEVEARIATEEIAAALANKLTIAKTELIKTEALVAQHKHEEALTAILQEIVRIRLAGTEDRARITSEYLERMKANAEAFDTETTEIEARIQKYLDFNDKLMVAIQEYQNDLQTRLERLNQDITIQQAKIEILEEQAKELTVPPTPTPAQDPETPTPEPES